MERIKNGRRDITIHGNADAEDVPVNEFPADARVGSTDGFVPVNMDQLTLFPGDVIVGVYDGEIRFAELVYDKVDEGVLVDPLDSGTIELVQDQMFSRRFFQADEIHVYDNVVDEMADREGVEFDPDKIERPEAARQRPGMARRR